MIYIIALISILAGILEIKFGIKELGKEGWFLIVIGLSTIVFGLILGILGVELLIMRL